MLHSINKKIKTQHKLPIIEKIENYFLSLLTVKYSDIDIDISENTRTEIKEENTTHHRTGYDFLSAG